MSSQFNVEAKFEADVSSFIKNVNKAIDVVADMNSDAGMDNLEKSLVSASVAAQEMAKSLKEAGQAGSNVGTETVKSLGKADEAIRKHKQLLAGLKKTSDFSNAIGANNPLMNRFSAAEGKQAASAAKQKIAAQKRFETYKLASDKRVAASGIAQVKKDVAVAQQQVSKQTQGVQKQTGSINAQRYALYDLARTWTVISGAISGVLAISAKIGIDFERNFADVRRTTEITGEAARDLQKDLVDLSTTIPQSFGNITEIAALAGQLGIANDAVAGFTETVAKFSATTGVSVDAAASQLGRLAQLTGTPQSEFENLGSAILKTGINAVATEGDILNLASQIATAGNLAGFSADEVVGLASALASLGVRPERARGTIQRLFAFITSAASEGGAVLEQYADIAGQTADEFATAWTNKPQEAFTSFIEGMGAMQEAGTDTNAVLADLGISSVRDVQTIQVLSNNVDVLADAFRNTASGYVDATQLSESFSVTVNTLSDKLLILKNTLAAIVANLGGQTNSALTVFVDWLQKAADALQAISDSAFLKWTALIVAGLAGVVAIMTGMMAVTALATASLFAMKTAQEGLAGTGYATVGAVKALVRELIKMTTANFGAALSTKGTTAALNGQVAASGRARVAMLALRGAMLGTGAGLVIAGLVYGIKKLAEHFESAESKATKFYGTLSGLGSAIRKDTEIWQETGEAIRTVTTEQIKNTEEVDENIVSLANAVGANKDRTESVEDSTEKIKENTYAIGENALAVIQAAYIDDESIQDVWREQGDAIEAAGFKLDEYILKNTEGKEAASDYLDPITESLVDQMNALEAQIFTLGVGSDAVEGLTQEYTDLGNTLRGIRTIQQSAEDGSKGIQLAMDGLVLEVAAAGGAIDEFGDDAEDAEKKISDLKSASEELAGSMFEISNASSDVEGAMFNLGKSVQDNGGTFSEFSEEGRSNLESVSAAVNALAVQAGDDVDMFSQNLAIMLQNLSDSGVDTENELGFVWDALTELTNSRFGISLDSSDARSSIQAFIADAIKAIKVRAEIERAAYNFNTGAEMGGAGNARFAVPEFDSSSFDSQIKALENLGKEVDKAGTEAAKSGRSFGRGFAPAADRAGRSARSAGKAAKKAGKDMKEAAKEVRTMGDYISDLTSVSDRAFEFRFNTTISKDGVTEAWRDLKEALAGDFDLSEIFEKSLGRKVGKDAIRETYLNMLDAAKDAREAVLAANRAIQQSMADLAGLGADKTVLNYQLGVAMDYGDSEREKVIRAELAKVAADQAKAEADLRKAKEESRAAAEAQNKTLKGNSRTAIDNRNDIRGMVSGQLDYIDVLKNTGASEKKISKAVKAAEKDFKAQAVALGFSKSELKVYTDTIRNANPQIDQNSTALKGNSQEAIDNRRALENVTKAEQDHIIKLIESGASQKTVDKAIAAATSRLKTQAKQLGFNQRDIKPYIKSLKDLRYIIKKVPKNLTVNTKLKNPAKRALDAFLRKYRNNKVNITAKVRTPGSISGGQYRPSSISSRGALYAPRVQTPLVSATRGVFSTMNAGKIAGGLHGGTLRAGGGSIPEYRSGGGKIGSEQMSMGPSGTDTTPVWATPGEFMHQKKAVDHYGLPFMNAINNMQAPRTFAAPNSSPAKSNNSNQIQIVELVPNNIKQLASAVSTQLSVDGKVLAGTVNSRNVNAARKGSA